SYNVRSDFLPVLDSVAVVLKKYKDTRLRVVGHTDSTGSARYNQLLSQQRAQAVADVLIRDGVPATRITVIGRGENDPIASNATPEGRAQNRRVEILIEPA
ncbi:MAG TPA: OmpA family protein, partial [Chromatiales bacterium]|nr:OmpA family protein [Chromatiales bacterium]